MHSFSLFVQLNILQIWRFEHILSYWNFIETQILKIRNAVWGWIIGLKSWDAWLVSWFEFYILFKFHAYFIGLLRLLLNFLLVVRTEFLKNDCSLLFFFNSALRANKESVWIVYNQGSFTQNTTFSMRVENDDGWRWFLTKSR